ncbi:MAG: MarR family winged helix-turn-helix transcriptional regulator [Anaerolineae bacterium]
MSERELAGQVLEVVPRLNRWLARHLQQVREASRLSIAQFGVLLFIHHHGNCAQSDLVTWRGVAAATMSRTVDTLVDRGWLVRERATEDRRRVLLCLSPEGEEYVACLLEQMQAAVARDLRALGAADQASLAACLSRLATLVGSVPHPDPSLTSATGKDGVRRPDFA